MTSELLWEKVKGNLGSDRNIDQSIYNQYIATAKMEEINDMEYIIIAKSIVSKSIINDNLDTINRVIKTQLGHNVALTILTAKENVNRKKVVEKSVIKDDFKFSFDHFVTGSSNKQAFMAAKAVSENLGTQWNPLFIFGNSGLGKTHLLRAIEHVSSAKNNTKYFTSEDFGRQVVDVIPKGTEEINEFKDSIQNYDVLLIDDIQFIAKRDKTNEFFFTIFNHFIENDKQIVITSDKGPEDLNGFDQRLITRFNSGLTISINSPDIDTAKSIIDEELKIQGNSYKIEDEAKNYIATFYASDIRKIKGTINRLSFLMLSQMDKDVVTLEDVQEFFKDIPTSNLGKLNVTKIKEAVAEKYGMSVAKIDSKIRTADVVTARHVAMYLTKDILEKSLTQIGNEFGNKDHTTVMHAITKIEDKISSDKEFKKIIQKLKNQITTH